MKILSSATVIVASFTLLSLEATAGLIANAKDFATIARNNAFRLNTSKPELKPPVIQPNLPRVSLQGVTTLLDSRQALLTIQTATKPDAAEVSCILGEGQALVGVKVLRIDMESATVWLTNQDVEQVLSLKQ
jgi:hypothetical protein